MNVELPASILSSAIDLASKPLPDGSHDHPSISVIVDWWNQNAPTDMRDAWGFMYYVQVEDTEGNPVWASGDVEEGYVHNSKMHPVRAGEATVLEDRIRVAFYRDGDDRFANESIVEEAHYIHEALARFPKRFPDTYERLKSNA